MIPVHKLGKMGLWAVSEKIVKIVRNSSKG
jgi:hypothetical protein